MDIVQAPARESPPKDQDPGLALHGELNSSPELNALSSPDPGASLFVWGIWVLIVLQGLVYLWTFATNVPYWDDWHWVPALTGEQPEFLKWLWAQHNEHRIPVPRLLLVGLFRLTGGDFRSGMVLQVLSLAGLSAALILAARKQRGWTSYPDAFFPLVLLTLAHYENLLWFSQFQIVLVSLLAGIWLVVLVRAGNRLTLGGSVLAGICLLILPGCGAGGLIYVPPLSLFLTYWGVRTWRSGEPAGKRSSLVMFAFACAGILLLCLYFIGYQRPAHHLASPGPWATLLWSVHVLGLGFGMILGMKWWPYPGIALGSLLAVSAVAAAGIWYAQPESRPRALGLLLFLAAVVSLVIGISWGRAGNTETSELDMPVPRYFTLVAPALCGAYYVWGMFQRPTVNRLAQMSLFTCAAAAALVSLPEGLYYAQEVRRPRADAFVKDLRQGMPPFLLAERHARHIFAGNTDQMTGYLEMLHRAGVGPFRQMRMIPPIREVPLALEPAVVHQVTWEGNGVARCTGNDSYLVFALESLQPVYEIRLRCSYEDLTSRPVLQVFWRNSEQGDFTSARSQTFELKSGLEAIDLHIRVGALIDQIRVDPDNKPCLFKISEIVVFVAEFGP